jgi:hypothetical protein
VLVTLYFWWRNTKGIHESSDDALKIMYVALCGNYPSKRPRPRRPHLNRQPLNLSINEQRACSAAFYFFL